MHHTTTKSLQSWIQQRQTTTKKVSRIILYYRYIYARNRHYNKISVWYANINISLYQQISETEIKISGPWSANPVCARFIRVLVWLLRPCIIIIIIVGLLFCWVVCCTLKCCNDSAIIGELTNNTTKCAHAVAVGRYIQQALQRPK